MKKQPAALETPVRPASTGHKRGWVGNSPTPAQLKAFFDQIPTEENPKGLNTSERLQKYLRNAPFVGEAVVPPPVKLRDENIAQLAEKKIFELFPNRVHEIMTILEPFFSLDFRFEIKPLKHPCPKEGEKPNSEDLREVAEVYVMSAFSFWCPEIRGASFHEIREGSPCNRPGRHLTGSHDFKDLVEKIYLEPRKTQYNLNASLARDVDTIARYGDRAIPQAYHSMEAMRYGLIDSGCADRIALLTRKLLEVAITMAAVGDTERMEKTKVALDFHLGGNPVVDYNPERKWLTVLCSPPYRTQ